MVCQAYYYRVEAVGRTRQEAIDSIDEWGGDSPVRRRITARLKGRSVGKRKP